jgi:hypothetical protein
MEKIFIVGCDRSGTTMLASMIGSYENTSVLPEAQFMAEFLKLKDLKNNENIGSAFKKYVINHKRYRIWEKKLDEFSWDCVTKGEDFNTVYEIFVREYDKENTIKRVVDHTPCNINSVNIINNKLKNCKFIFLYRDPRAVVSSLLRTDWGPNDIIGCTNKWLSTMAKGLCYEQISDNIKFITIKYEKLVNKDNCELKKVAEHLEEKDLSLLLNTNGFNLPKYNYKTHNILGNGLTSDRINSWKVSLSNREIEICEQMCGEMLECLEYSAINGNPAMATPVEKVKFIISDSFKNLINRVLKRKRQADSKV